MDKRNIKPYVTQGLYAIDDAIATFVSHILTQGTSPEDLDHAEQVLALLNTAEHLMMKWPGMAAENLEYLTERHPSKGEGYETLQLLLERQVAADSQTTFVKEAGDPATACGGNDEQTP